MGKGLGRSWHVCSMCVCVCLVLFCSFCSECPLGKCHFVSRSVAHENSNVSTLSHVSMGREGGREGGAEGGGETVAYCRLTFPFFPSFLSCLTPFPHLYILKHTRLRSDCTCDSWGVCVRVNECVRLSLFLVRWSLCVGVGE